MTSRRYQELRKHFFKLADLPPDQQVHYFNEHFSGESVVRSEMHELLALDRQHLGDDPPKISQLESVERLDSIPTESLPKSLGPYEIIGPIGSGGMGEVFEARQKRPSRTVAIKLLRIESLSDSVIRRFQMEVEVLGHLRHPHIAQIFSSGSYLEQGSSRPWFAMEFVPDAQSLKSYAQQHQLGTSQRLKLFLDVCDAVQHAHQKGVIHRDLNPANVLVDSRGNVKVLDFGVALVLKDRWQDSSMNTSPGQLIGTLPYMSPEQASASPESHDVRTDVYSLGVMLFELLTNRLPYEIGDLSLFQVLQCICETQPPLAGTVDRRLRGDLENVVRKALEKDQALRYQSVIALANDLQRYLRHEPVTARAPGLAYRMAKFSQRNKVLVSVITLCVCLVTVAVIFMAMALGSSKLAERNSQKTIGLFTEFLDSDYFNRSGADVKFIEVIRDVELRMRNSPEQYPKPLLSTIHLTLGRNYLALDDSKKCREHLVKALALNEELYGWNDKRTLDAANLMARYHISLFQGDEARQLLSSAEPFCLKTLGEYHPLTIEVRHHIALATAYCNDYPAAEKIWRSILVDAVNVLGDEHELVFDITNSLGMLYLKWQKLVLAEQWIGNTWKKRIHVFGELHTDTLRSTNNYASVLIASGRFDEAVELLKRTVARIVDKFGDDHRESIAMRLNLARALERTGMIEESAELFQDIHEGCRDNLGEHSYFTFLAKLRLAEFYAKNKQSDAPPLFRELLECIQTNSIKGNIDQLVGHFFEKYGRFELEQNRFVQARELLLQAVEEFDDVGRKDRKQNAMELLTEVEKRMRANATH